MKSGIPGLPPDTGGAGKGTDWSIMGRSRIQHNPQILLIAISKLFSDQNHNSGQKREKDLNENCK
jgi:hypothetical protein